MRRAPRAAALLIVVVAASASPQSRSGEPRSPVTPSLALPTRPLEESIRFGPVHATIGTDEDAGPTMFAAIGQIARGGDGTIYIAEYTTYQIRAFDSAGRFLGLSGRRGRGPGEFIESFGLHHDGDSTLFATQGYFGVSEFTARGGALRYRGTFGASTRTGMVCTLGSRLFLSLGDDSSVVHELDADRRTVREFGTPFGKYENDALERESNLDPPRIACDAAANAIYVWRHDLGVIRRYDIDGTLRWETTMPSFSQAYFVPQPGGRAASGFGADQITSVVRAGRSRLLIQVVTSDLGSAVRRGNSVRIAEARRTWYVMDAVSGKLLAKSASRGSIGIVGNALAVESVDDPWPMARFRTLQAVVP